MAISNQYTDPNGNIIGYTNEEYENILKSVVVDSITKALDRASDGRSNEDLQSIASLAGGLMHSHQSTIEPDLPRNGVGQYV